MTKLGGRSVLVTGAGGFIGGHLVARLVAEGARVRAFVHYNSRGDRGTLDWLDPAAVADVEVVAGELRDIESVTRAVSAAEVVFHLAAQIAIPYSYVNPRDFVEVNALGSLNVAQAALAAGVERLVHTSTSEVYGAARSVPITEDHPLEPQSPYAASKVAADKLMDSFHRSFDLPVTILRPFNTYGPHQSARAILPTIITQALAGPTLRLGSLHPRRDMTFVEDTAAGFIAVAEADERVVGRTVQLGTGVDVSVGEMVQLVGDLVGKELTVETDPARVRPPNSEVERLISDPALAASLAGWRPRVDLRDGVGRTIEWIERHAARFRAGEYAI
jgi:NAD dependent epimerase/dehydratase